MRVMLHNNADEKAAVYENAVISVKDKLVLIGKTGLVAFDVIANAVSIFGF